MPPHSWVPVEPNSAFTLHNIPFGVFSHGTGPKRIGTAIGTYVLDLAALKRRGLFNGPHLQASNCFEQESLNALMGLGCPAWREARRDIQALLDGSDSTLKDSKQLQAEVLVPQAEVIMHLPANIGDYTDFYASREHATTCGEILRGKDNALTPNWLHLPVAYHGRSSSVVVSGTAVHRPRGQSLAGDAQQPQLSPCRWLDFELEMAAFIGGPGNDVGCPVSIQDATDRIFGLVLMNDWSARDVQKWEMVPLGPFASKNFATSVSPWVVTLDALQPFRCDAPVQSNPDVLPYLQERNRHSFDIQLSVELTPQDGGKPTRITTSNFKHLYWTLEQMVTHHTVTGCNLRPGDLLGTGTISSPENGGQGSLLEHTMGGQRPVTLADGTQRIFLEDNDAVTLRGWCERGQYSLGFGSCTGQVLSART